MKIFLTIAAIMSLVLMSVAIAVLDEASAGASVTVNEFLDITITDPSPSGFSFDSLDPGTINKNESSQVDGVSSVDPAVTINNEATSNIAANIKLKGTDFTNNGDTIAVTFVSYDDEGAVDEVSDSGALLQTNLTTSYPGSAYTSLAVGSSLDIWFWLDVPSGQAAGSYTSTFSFQGSS